MVSIPILIPFLIAPLLRLEKKLEIKKNENNEIIVIITTYGNCTKIFNFPIENTAFEVISDGFHGDLEQGQPLVRIIFYNTSLKEIDLDNSNIRNAPFKSIITFKAYIGNKKEIESKLSKYINNIFDNKINDELKLYVPNLEHFNGNRFFYHIMPDRKGFGQMIKISDYYYIYYTYTYYSDNNYSEMFRRIDWVYSKNFDRLFIGVVKDDNYLKSGTYNINEIDKFVLISNIYNNNAYSFKVCLKDGRNEDICEFQRQDKTVLDCFIYLINGQKNNITKN
jgi:hypothetical protein